MNEDDFEELKKKKDALDKLISEMEKDGVQLYSMPGLDKAKLEEIDKLINEIKNQAEFYYASMNLNKIFAENYKKRGDVKRYNQYLKRYKESAQEFKRRIEDLENLTDFKLSIVRGDPYAFKDSVTKILKGQGKSTRQKRSTKQRK